MTDSSLPPVLGVALSDAAATQLLTQNEPTHYAVLRDIVDLTSAGVIYLGADRHRLKPVGSKYLDPLFAASALLSRIPSAAALVSVTPDVEHPYNYARRVLTVDHFTEGRIGVVLGSRDRRAARSDWGTTPWTDTPTGPEVTADFAGVLRRLWNSWPRESIVVDRDNGRFAQSEKVVRIDYEGLYSVAGPLNSPSSIQGEPPLGWQISLGGAEAPFIADAEFLITELGEPTAEEGAADSIGPLNISLVQAPQIDSELDALHQRGDVASALIRVEALEELSGVSSVLSRIHSRSSPGKVGHTLRQRLGLEARSLDTTNYSPAFAD